MNHAHNGNILKINSSVYPTFILHSIFMVYLFETTDQMKIQSHTCIFNDLDRMCIKFWSI
jgi:hypothetical protein